MSKTRCAFKDCAAWAFENGLCRQHVKQAELDPTAKEQVKLTEMYRSAPAIKQNLVVTQPSAHPSHMALAAGDMVDVLAVCSDQCTYVCRAPAGLVGYYDGRLLMTEEEVYAEFLREEQERAAVAERERVEQARLQEQQYEQYLRDCMKLKAEEDRVRREMEAEQRRVQYEEQVRLYIAEQQRAAEAMARAEEERKRAKEEAARRYAEEQRMRAIEAHAVREVEEIVSAEMRAQKEAERVAWEQEQARRKEQAYLDTLPKWRRELVLRKKKEAESKPQLPPSPAKPVLKFVQGLPLK